MEDFENPFDDASFDDSHSYSGGITTTSASTTTNNNNNNNNNNTTIDFFDVQSKPQPQSQSQPATEPPPVDRRAKELEKRMSELDRRERELNEREAALNRREQDLEAQKLANEAAISNSASLGTFDAHAPNWPPWPKPLVYQNFDDVPTGLQRLVKCTYFNWMAGEVILVYNLICALAVTFAGNSSAISDIILAAIYVAGWTFLSFFIYRRLYKATISGKSLKYFMFFAGFAVQIVFDGFGVAGLKGSGFMGVFWTISAFGKNAVAGFMCLACAILWGLTMAFCIYIWIHVRVVYKDAGGLRATKKEASERAAEKAVDFAKENPDVVMDAATTGAKAAMSSNH